MSNWTKIGECGVDSGQIMIVDPCYVLPDGGREGFDYRDLTKEWEKRNWKPQHFEVRDGVIVSSGYGDGIYSVYAKYKDGRVAAVMIDFMDEE